MNDRTMTVWVGEGEQVMAREAISLSDGVYKIPQKEGGFIYGKVGRAFHFTKREALEDLIDIWEVRRKMVLDTLSRLHLKRSMLELTDMEEEMREGERDHGAERG